jgi:hypothetical protein
VTALAFFVLRSFLTRPGAWLSVLAVALGSYLRLAAASSADVSAVAISPTAGAAESPVCDGPRDAPRLGADVDDAALLHAARPPLRDEAEPALRLRAGAGPYELCAAAHGTSLRHMRAAHTRAPARRGAPADSPARRRARSMVFLN